MSLFPRKKVAILGAGASGLAATKCCLDEGLEPVCLERTGYLGGMWRYTDEVSDGQASVMKSTVINTSKEMMCFSDFPIPADYANFMHNSQLYKYFKLYAEHFKLLDHVRFSTEVIKVKQTEDYAKTGRWEVEMKDKTTGKTTKEVFDAVLVCTGHHADKKMPNFPGEKDFQGKIVHTHDYRNHKGYEDKRVVVVGVGNSGLDCAVELSKICSQVYMSTRRGAWVMNRVSDNGMPIDMHLTRRAVQSVQDALPRWLKNGIAESKLNGRFNHYDYGLGPSHRWDSQHPSVNDELPNRIACGSLLVKSNVKRLTKTGVEFDDGTSVDDIDVVIYATGFIFGFPFIDHPLMKVVDNKIDLYKYSWPPKMEHNSLAVIGYFQPLGAINPISELQCRWAARVFKGATKLPNQEQMMANISEKRAKMGERYVDSTRHTIQVDWISFMDDVAMEFGCKPDIAHLWFTDPKLAFQVVFGPCSTYQFRLNGPGSWSGARKAIMTQWDRALAPMKTRDAGSPANDHILMWVIAVAVLAWLLKWLLESIVF